RFSIYGAQRFEDHRVVLDDEAHDLVLGIAFVLRHVAPLPNQTSELAGDRARRWRSGLLRDAATVRPSAKNLHARAYLSAVDAMPADATPRCPSHPCAPHLRTGERQALPRALVRPHPGGRRTPRSS